MATCGEAAIRLLEQYDADTVFGIPGVHTLEFYRGLAHSPIRHVTPRHEQGAGFMALGYARVTGRPGVCCLITGAGLSNAATAIASAHHDSQPLLILSSNSDSADAGKEHGALHDLPDQPAFMSTICAASFDVRDPGDLVEAFADAYAIFDSGRPRPVHIGVPLDILAQPSAGLERLAARGAAPVADPAAVTQAVERLASATRPMILVGGGAARCGAEIAALAECLGAPVTTTIAAKGALPDAHPLALGTTCTIGPVYEALEQADVVVAIATEFSETDYFYAPDFAPPDFQGTLIRIDIDAEQLSKRRPAAIGLHGDAAATLVALESALGERAIECAGGAERAAALRAAIDWSAVDGPFAEFLAALDQSIPEGGILAVDSTQPGYAAAQHWRGEFPGGYLHYGGFGTLGPSLPMAIGAKVGAPGRPVAALAGDGGLLFTIPELATAADLGLPLPVIVWNNRGYGEIADSMDRADVPQVGVDTTARDFPAIARGFGCHGVAVGTIAALPSAIAEAFAADRPTLIDVAVA
jgi:acetolactate synthase-1/2/3 large subunit